MEQRPGVRQHDRVVVHVDDPGRRRHGLGDLVGVVRRRDAGPDIQELADLAVPGQEAHRPGEERPVGPCGQPDLREGLDRLLARGPVGGEVVLPAEPVVVHPGDVRHARVDRQRRTAIDYLLAAFTRH